MKVVHHFQGGLDHARPRARDAFGHEGVNSPFGYRRECVPRSPDLIQLTSFSHGWLEDHLGGEANHDLAIELHPSASGDHVLAAGGDEQLVREGLRSRRVDRVMIEDQQCAGMLSVSGALRDLSEGRPNVLDDRNGRGFTTDDAAEPRHVLENLLETLIVNQIHVDVCVSKGPDESEVFLNDRAHHQVRAKRQYALHIGVHAAADLWQLLRRGGEITENADADDMLPNTETEKHIRRARHRRHDPLW